MINDNLDKETKKIFSDGEKLKSMTESEGWSIAKQLLLKKVAEQLNLSNITNIDPNNIVQIIGIRQETAKALMEWLREIEGNVEQHTSNSGAFSEVNDEFIIHFKQ